MMDRIDYRTWAEQLRKENDAMRADMAARREQLGDEAFEAPIARRDWSPPTARRSTVGENSPTEKRYETTIEKRVVAEMVREMQAAVPASQLVDDALLNDALHRTVGMLSEEIALIRHQIEQKQDDAVRRLTERLDGIDARLDEMQSQIDALANDVADIVDRSSGKVTALKTRSR